MANLSKYVSYTSSKGQPIKYDGKVLTPVSQALTVQLPFWGWVWNRPTAIEIDDGQSIENIPIVDVTLMARIGLYGIGLAAGVLALMAGRRRRR